VNKEAFTGLTDYIQYGLASGASRLVFQRLFRTKALSVLFTQWRKRYAHRLFKRGLTQIHTVHLAKQSLLEWRRHLQQRRLHALNFQRTRHIERGYTLFRRWAAASREGARRREAVVRGFRKRLVLKGWMRHL
jgi:hypothetical protein